MAAPSSLYRTRSSQRVINLLTPSSFCAKHMAASSSEALSRSSSMSLPDGGSSSVRGLRPSENDVQLSLDLRAGLAEQPAAPGAVLHGQCDPRSLFGVHCTSPMAVFPVAAWLQHRTDAAEQPAAPGAAFGIGLNCRRSSQC